MPSASDRAPFNRKHLKSLAAQVRRRARTLATTTLIPTTDKERKCYMFSRNPCAMFDNRIPDDVTLNPSALDYYNASPRDDLPWTQTASQPSNWTLRGNSTNLPWTTLALGTQVPPSVSP